MVSRGVVSAQVALLILQQLPQFWGNLFLLLTQGLLIWEWHVHPGFYTCGVFDSGYFANFNILRQFLFQSISERVLERGKCAVDVCSRGGAGFVAGDGWGDFDLETASQRLPRWLGQLLPRCAGTAGDIETRMPRFFSIARCHCFGIVVLSFCLVARI